MDYKEYIKLIGNDNIKPVCILYGDEEYVKESVIERLKKSYIDPSMTEFDMNIFDAQSATYDNIIPAANSPAMASKRRIILVCIKPESALLKDEHFAELCCNVGDDILLIIDVDGKPDRRSAVFKKIESAADSVSFEQLDKTDIIKWITLKFKENGKKIARSDAEYLVLLSGEELFQLQSEIGKLVDCTDEDTITRSDIDMMVAHTPEHGVFSLVDAVAAKKPAEAAKQCRLLINDGSDEFGLLALVERQYQLILRYIYYTQNGVSQKEIMEKLSLKPFIYDKIKRQAANYTLDACKTALQKCLDLDYAVKTGKADIKTDFGLLIIKLCGIKQ